jgi:hypothetical protein
VACLCLDSCGDHYAAADLPAKWTTTAGTITVVSGRFAGSALRLSGSTAALTKAITAGATFIVGFAVQLNTAGMAPTVLALTDAGTTQVDLRITASGTINVTRNGTSLGTSSTTLSAGWNYIELKAKIDPTTGTIDVKLNETNVLSLTGQNTRNTANSSANGVKFTNNVTSSTLDLDDVYVLDSTGGVNDTFWGDTKIDAKFPSANGNYTAWTANGAASLYDCVDDGTPDGDTTYASSATLNQLMSFVMGDVPAGATVRAVQSVISARKDDAGTRTFAPLIRNGGTDAVGNNQNLTASFVYYLQQYDKDPTDNGAWTAAKVNSLELGAKLIA